MRPRLRHYGISLGRLAPGPTNTIRDVEGVGVGHVTLTARQGYPANICTGVTAIVPHQGNWFEQKVPATSFVINGYGKTTGLVQLQELGCLESPILLTNTFSVPAVTEGVLRYMTGRDDEIGRGKGSLNVVVGECNDGYLNDMPAFYVQGQHAKLAIEKALASDDVEEGGIGAGAGMRCFGWKGGIGTSSRQVSWRDTHYIVGALVLSNFGEARDLVIGGVPVGEQLAREEQLAQEEQLAREEQLAQEEQLAREEQFAESVGDVSEESADEQSDNAGTPGGDGSIIIILATNAPLDSRQLGRLARRASFGLARTGSIAHHGSGDIVIAFSTAIENVPPLNAPIKIDDTELSPFFRGVVEAVEEAVVNSLFTAETTLGSGDRVVEALPVERVIPVLQRWQQLSNSYRYQNTGL